MTIREIFMEMTDKHMQDEISLGQMSSILDTEIVPKKFIDDILEMFRLWKKNCEISLDALSKYADDREQYTNDRLRFEEKKIVLEWCIDYIEIQLEDLEAEE